MVKSLEHYTSHLLDLSPMCKGVQCRVKTTGKRPGYRNRVNKSIPLTWKGQMLPMYLTHVNGRGIYQVTGGRGGPERRRRRGRKCNGGSCTTEG